MSRFNFTKTSLSELLVVQRKTLDDHRGFLSRFYCMDEFSEVGIKVSIAQMNHTLTRERGAVRGLHFQKAPHAEIKMVSCLKGEVWDVAVDLRRNSPTFLKWHGEVLSAENRRSLLIPKGFAHGFQTLLADCELIYLHTERFHPESENALNVMDPKLDINWPLAIKDLSERDSNHPFIDQNFQGIIL